MKKNNHGCKNCGHIKIKHLNDKCRIRNCRCKSFEDTLNE